MAANSQSRGFASFGKRFVNQIWSSHSSPNPSSRSLLPDSSSPTSTLIIRRGAHFSVYDKNVDEQVRPTVVPDDVIQPQSDKYWGPHPQTGVFGPASEGSTGGGPTGTGDFNYPPRNGGGESGESVLEQKAWFRPLEDVEKPQPN
ncbi:hypothetical protein BVC80_1833g148 [Macleaya cordata]|uniref:Late embryogenesis abundant protein n=1 Tax=Macleaya cordata TaxID=56857 RepID=A0A200R707_MACCD|nr:hypothetical protein BVC80_1833g148 [Macleaya cordata]